MSRQISLEKEYIETSKIIVSFGGDSSIDAELLSSSINDIVTLVQNVNNEVSPNTPMTLKINAFRPGSFVVDFDGIMT